MSISSAGLGKDRASISTQSHNVMVMSTFARLGWISVKSMLTVQLVRRSLLPASKVCVFDDALGFC